MQSDGTYVRPHTRKSPSRSDFWRGVIDGDGHLKFKNSKTLQLTGNLSIVTAFKNFCEPFIDGKIYPISKCKNSFSYRVFGENAKYITSKLYSNAVICMERKKRIAEEILASKAKTSKFRCVSYCKRDKKFTSSIKIENKKHYIGYFNTEEQAAIAYNNYVIKNSLNRPLNIVGEKNVNT